MFRSLFKFLCVLTLCRAFAPIASSRRVDMELELGRREVFGAAVGLLILPNVASASNPALETFKGSKKTKVCNVLLSKRLGLIYKFQSCR